MSLWATVRARLFGSHAEDAGTAALDASPDRRVRVNADAELVSGPTPDDAATASAADPSRVAARQERAASRILDDERLRGNLTDDEFQPLLDWALRVTDLIAADTVDLGNAEADSRIDWGMQVIRDVVGAAGAAIVAHNEGDADRRASELSFIGSQWPELPTGATGGVPAPAVARRLDSLAERLAAEPELSGAAVATLIVEALTSASAGQPQLDSPAASQGAGGQGAVGIEDVGPAGREHPSMPRDASHDIEADESYAQRPPGRVEGDSHHEGAP